MNRFRLRVRHMSHYFVILNRRAFTPSALPEFIVTMRASDSHYTISDSSLVRFVIRMQPSRAALQWVSLVTMLSQCQTRTWLRSRERPNWLAIDASLDVACGCSETLGHSNHRIFGTQSIQGQLHLLPLALVYSPDYASTSWLPTSPQAWIPSPWLRVTWRASHS